MALNLPEPEDTELNMTPMIDIVFQLIIFFLLSLKFKNIDRRIDSMLPKDRGMAATPTFPEDLNTVKVKVFRRDLGKPSEHTMMKIENSKNIFLLPKQWKGRSKEEAANNTARVEEYDSKFNQLYEAIRKRLGPEVVAALQAAYTAEDQGKTVDNAKIKGEIVAPPPKGGAVPHGDVMGVLNVYLKLGITDVVFEGKATPLTSTERAARAQGK